MHRFTCDKKSDAGSPRLGTSGLGMFPVYAGFVLEQDSSSGLRSTGPGSIESCRRSDSLEAKSDLGIPA